MIARTRVLTTESTDPHRNLAIEEALLNGLAPGEAILFLWRNRHTVVLGAGQNAWRECDTALLEAEGGVLARRSSGGGAVYHDLGNLNYSLLLPRADYDVATQLDFIAGAVAGFGIDARPSGRNDLLADGRKFSGSAFRLLERSALHHGTLMVNVDAEKLRRYLTVDPEKLKAKGVSSVRNRVVNLSELGDVTIEALREALAREFFRRWGSGEREEIREEALPGFQELYRRNQTWEWNYGRSPRGSLSVQKRFPWGAVELRGDVVGGFLENPQVFTDAMDETLAPRLERALNGCPYRGAELRKQALLLQLPDLADWFGTL